jgi:hypothetical protein
VVEGLVLSVQVEPTRLRGESVARVSSTMRNMTTSPVVIRVIAPVWALGSIPVDVSVDEPLTDLFDGPPPACPVVLGADVGDPEPDVVELELAAGGTLVFPDATVEFQLPPIDESCEWRPFPKGKHTVRVSVEVAAGKRVYGSARVEIRR